MTGAPSAFMAERIEPRDSLDDFPTHPWATRALCERVLGREVCAAATVWEPAANRGYMVRPLREYFRHVWASDIHDYAAAFPIFDFLSIGCGLTPAVPPCRDERPDWIITNHPFNNTDAWIERAVSIATVGVALFARLQVIEGVTRYTAFFEKWDPCQWVFAQFVERVPLAKGRINFESTKTAYGWLVYWHATQDPVRLLRCRQLAPTCEHEYRRPDDYRWQPGEPG